MQLLFGDILVEVLDVTISETFGFFSKLDLPLLSWHEASHENLKLTKMDFYINPALCLARPKILTHLLAVQQHAIYFGNGIDSGLFGLEVDETVALAIAGGVLGDLAAQYVSEGGKGVVHGFVINTLVKILDEDIANAGATERGVSLGPHDADGAALQHVKVHGIQGSLSCKCIHCSLKTYLNLRVD